jgi:hypothetical protein
MLGLYKPQVGRTCTYLDDIYVPTLFVYTIIYRREYTRNPTRQIILLLLLQ